jgi:large repetitive protein
LGRSRVYSLRAEISGQQKDLCMQTLRGKLVRRGAAALAGIAVLTAGMATLVAGVSSAAGATAPPWEPDGDAAVPYGYLMFFDSAGNQVSSGTNLSHLFDYAATSSAFDPGANKASMFFANPAFGILPANWGVDSSTASLTTTFTTLPATTPANILNAATTKAVVSTGTGYANLATFLQKVVLDTHPGYVNTTQIRLEDSGPGGVGNLGTSQYWETDIAFNQTGSPITVEGTSVPANGWAQIFPFISPTTTTLAATPPSPQPAGTAVTLQATVTPTTAAGFVQFYNGTALLGKPVKVTSGSAKYVVRPAVGTHPYSAVFLPAPSDVTHPHTKTTTMVGGSVSATLNFVVPKAPTVTAVSPNTGSHLGKQNVTITGTNLGTATAVDFGTVAATIKTKSATRITVSTPAGAVGTVNVTVTNPGGTSAVVAADKYTYS